MTEQKIIRVTNNDRKQLDHLLGNGWRVVSTNSQSQGWSCGKTCCLGIIFTPLALLGKKKDIIEYILEKEIKEPTSQKEQNG